MLGLMQQEGLVHPLRYLLINAVGVEVGRIVHCGVEVYVERRR